MGETPLHKAMRNLDGGRAAGSIDTINLLLAYGASVNAKEVSGNTPLDYVVNDAEGHVAAIALRLREAGGVCDYYGRVGRLYPECGLNFKPREFVKSVLHGVSGGLWTVTVGVASEASEVSYRLDSEDSRLSARGWTLGAEQGFVVSSEAPLSGGESLSASVALWAGLQTLSAPLAVTVIWSTVALDWIEGATLYAAAGYEGSLPAVSAAETADRGVSVRYGLSGESEDFVFDGTLRVLSTAPGVSMESGNLYSATLWAEGMRDGWRPLTLYATVAVSLLSVSLLSDVSRTITASPYADYSSGGGLITLSSLWEGLPGALSYEKAGGAEEFGGEGRGRVFALVRGRGDLGRALSDVGSGVGAVAGGFFVVFGGSGGGMRGGRGIWEGFA